MNFKEPLPDSCPPSQVKAPPNAALWRLISGTHVTPSDFESNAAKYPGRAYKDPCKARAVSLATSLDACRSIVKLPYPNVHGRTHAVEVKHEPAAGVWDHNDTSHVSYWVAATANPLALTGAVETL